MHSFKNDTLDIIPLPECQKIVHSKWVFMTKFWVDESMNKI